MKAPRKKTHRMILDELTKRNIISPLAKEAHGDIEEAIEQRGGARGSLNV